MIFVPKNTTSRPQPLDAGIIQNSKAKYQKRLVKYVFARIQEDACATQMSRVWMYLWVIEGYKKRGKK